MLQSIKNPTRSSKTPQQDARTRVRRCITLSIAFVAMALLTVSMLLETSLVHAGGMQDDADAPKTPATQAPAGTSTKTPAAVPAYRAATNVAVLRVDGVIDRVTLYSLERRIEKAVANGADAVVLDIHTPGGELSATLDICHLLKNDAPANTVAWVNNQAYSAGTIIALACREIVMAPGAFMGDAAPIVAGVPLPPTERAKAESPILAEVVDSARRHHYDENLVKSFISVGVELWLLENTTTGERVFVDRAEYEELFGEGPPAQTPLQTDAMLAQTAPPIMPMFNDSIPVVVDGPPLDPMAQAELEQTLAPTRSRLTEADRDSWRLIGDVVGDDMLLTLNQNEAAYYGLVRETIADDEELKAWFGATTVTRYDQAWSESLVRFLLSFWVRGLLIALFIICALIEMAAPGVGVFGAGAAVALLIFIGAPYLVGMAQWWDILLIVIGIVLILAELFVVPGFGIAGLLGAGCLLVGMVGTFVSGDVTQFADAEAQLFTGLGTTLTALFAAGIGLWLISRQVESIPALNRFVLSASVGADAAPSREPLLQAMGERPRPLMVGDDGTTVADLRPEGRADIHGRVVTVRSVGNFIERGQHVRVVSVGRSAIEVEQVKQDSAKEDIE